MDHSDDPRELERRIQQASRIASSISDETTVGRLTAWIETRRLRQAQQLRARGGLLPLLPVLSPLLLLSLLSGLLCSAQPTWPSHFNARRIEPSDDWVV